MIRNYLNTATAAMLLSLAVSRLLIYLGRRKIPEERYNLYFAIFSISVSLYVGINTLTLALPGTLPFGRFQPSLEVVCGLGLVFGGANFLAIVLGMKRRRVFLACYALLDAAFVLSLFNFIRGAPGDLAQDRRAPRAGHLRKARRPYQD